MINVSPIYGPAIGTCVSFVIGNNIICNIYYHKKIGIDMFRYFRKLTVGMMPAWIISLVLGIAIAFIPIGGWMGLIIKGGLYTAVYGACQWLIGANKSERALVGSMFKKVLRR